MHRYLTAVIVLTLGLAAGLAQGPATVLDGVYTAAQAERGHGAYESRCAGCHEGQDADGPELSGKVFLDRWREDKLSSLYSFIKTSMPGNLPGSLDDRTYSDIVAFVLELNGLPPGQKELTSEVVDSIQLVGLEGPRPLANLTIVMAVGCLKAEANSTWALANSGGMAPVRSRIVDGTSPEELKASSARPLGTQTFPLMSVAQPATALAGHKVQVKGVLTRQGPLDRINVMSLESVAASCAP